MIEKEEDMRNGGRWGQMNELTKGLIRQIAAEKLPTLPGTDEDKWKYDAVVLADRALKLDEYARTLEKKLKEVGQMSDPGPREFRSRSLSTAGFDRIWAPLGTEDEIMTGTILWVPRTGETIRVNSYKIEFSVNSPQKFVEILVQRKWGKSPAQKIDIGERIVILGYSEAEDGDAALATFLKEGGPAPYRFPAKLKEPIERNPKPRRAGSDKVDWIEDEKRPAILCYATDSQAYFTTKALSEQWGDDWNDAPFEHNAGRPYAYRADSDTEKEPWEIWVCYWAGPFRIPEGEFSNPGVSVQQINSGRVPWLWPDDDRAKFASIPAGVTYHEFRSLIEAQGGTVGVAKKYD